MVSQDGRKAFGQLGESLAAQHLRKQNYTIVTTNWRCPYGEIDIIASVGHTLVFVEVRTRHAASSEPAFESITPRKREKMTLLANAYIEAHELDDCAWRVDVIAIGIPRSGQPIIEHTEDALDW